MMRTPRLTLDGYVVGPEENDWRANREGAISSKEWIIDFSMTTKAKRPSGNTTSRLPIRDSNSLSLSLSLCLVNPK